MSPAKCQGLSSISGLRQARKCSQVLRSTSHSLFPYESRIVPDLVGQRQTGAEALLGRNTLRIGGVISRASKEPAGVIVDQRPAAGRQVDPASTVDIWVASRCRLQP